MIAIHTIGRGGYGIISEDFSSMMKRLRKGSGGGLDKELKGLMKKADSKRKEKLFKRKRKNMEKKRRNKR